MEIIGEILEKIPIKKSIITRREYEWLSTFESLQPHELAKIKEFENFEKTRQIQKIATKTKLVIEKKQGLLLNKSTLWQGFIQSFYKTQGKKFEKTKDTLSNLEPVFKYFLKDASFFECQNLVKNINKIELNNCFEKGLLIVGNFGNGKTSVMKTFEVLFKTNADLAYLENWHNASDWLKLRFKGIKSHELVTEFEGLTNAESKANFYKKHSGFRYYFDDVKREKKASNYGTTEVIREVLEKRYDNKAKTFITCNYSENAPNDLHESLFEFGERYGGHIYDRLFEMFNIVEFKGVSFRR
jgi:DNA replication protein DnaC